MTMRADDVPVRVVGAVRMVAGVALVAAGPRILDRVDRRVVPRPAAVASRLLGLRDVVQGGWLVLRPDGIVVRVGDGLDGAHAASMVLLALVSPRYRRIGLVAAVQATTELAATRLTGRRG